jgi:hypothetical protein
MNLVISGYAMCLQLFKKKIASTGLKLDLSALASRVLGLQMCTTTLDSLQLLLGKMPAICMAGGKQSLLVGLDLMLG